LEKSRILSEGKELFSSYQASGLRLLPKQRQIQRCSGRELVTAEGLQSSKRIEGDLGILTTLGGGLMLTVTSAGPRYLGIVASGWQT